jgi:hypothetical protein
MPADPLCRIFGNAYAPISGIVGPKAPRTDPMPHYETDSKGFVTPCNFDNDTAIKVFEENLKTLVDNGGMKHPGVPDGAKGLAVLYEMKAGIEKNAEFYDKAIEYLEYANKSKEAALGSRSAKADSGYKANEGLAAKIARKKERRLAKGAAQQDSQLAIPPAARVTEVRLLTGGQLVFMFEDGTSKGFWKPGAKASQMGRLAEFGDIDDDVSERYTAPPLYLEDGEYIVGMVTHEKQQLGELNAISFHTSAGRRSHWFEFNTAEPRGREYSYWATKDCHVIGLETKASNLTVPCGLIEGGRAL